MDEDDDDLWGSNDESEDGEQAADDADDPMGEPERTALDIADDEDMDKEVGNRPPQPTTPIDTSTRIDTPYNISAHAQHASSAVVQAAIQRRQLFKPTPESLIQHLALDPFIVIPQPGHVHSLAVTPCMSYLLTGSEDGHVRAYDFWASANGKNFLSTQQRAMATLGEGVNKGGVVRGYWKNEVDVEEVVGDAPEQSTPAGPALPWMQAAQATQIQKEVVKVKKMQPVYSMAIQSDALWVVSGTETGVINLATLRHEPGKIAHVFDQSSHSKAVSALMLTDDEQHMISGGWDNCLKEWDLNTGQVVREYNKHKGPIAAMQFQPLSLPSAPDRGMGVSRTASSSKPTYEGEKKPNETNGTNGDNVMEDAAGSPDSYGSLFGDEDEEENGVLKQNKPAEKNPQSSVPQPNPQHSTQPSLPLPVSGVPGQVPIPSSRPGILSAGLKGQPRIGLPPLAPETFKQFSEDVMLVASMDGEVALHDRRADSTLVGKLEGGPKSGPWCMSACFSADGTQVIAGRRNATLDVWDVRKSGSSGSTQTPNLLRTLRHPATSQWVSAVAAFPDGKHIACASVDCVRLWNTADLWNPESSMKKSKSGVPFRIVAGHHGGTVSKIHIDPTGQYMITATGNRGWAGDATKVVLIHERKKV